MTVSVIITDYDKDLLESLNHTNGMKAYKWVSISVLPETRDKLQAIGKKNETYDEILNKLLAGVSK